MTSRIEIRCRLADLLLEKGVTPAELASATGLPLKRIAEYCDGTADSISLLEISDILSALDSRHITDILEEVVKLDDDLKDNDVPTMVEVEWKSPCPNSPDGKHRWFKDVKVSDTVYQEFVCQICRQRLSVIL